MKKSKLIRLISILIILGFTALNLTAVVSEKTLEIKAYKNYSTADDFMAVYITDAITSSLSLIAESRSKFEAGTSAGAPDLDITPYVEKQLLGNISSPEISEENIAFSYRVVGNQICHYTLELSISPFVQQVESSPHYIDAYYQILNENAVFQGTSSTKSTDEWEVSLVSTSSDDSTSSPNEAAGIRTEWIVKDSNGNSDHHSNVSPSQDVWIVRGALAVVVDREDYMGVPDGDYRAYCTVKVSHD